MAEELKDGFSNWLIEKLWNALKKTDISKKERKEIFEQFQKTFEALDEDIVKALKSEDIFHILLKQMKTSGVKQTEIEAFKKAYKAKPEAKAEAKPEAKPEAPPETVGGMDKRVVEAEAAEIEAAQKGEPIVPETRGPKIHKYDEMIIRGIIEDIRKAGGSAKNPQIAANIIASLPENHQETWKKNQEIARQLWKETSPKPTPPGEPPETPNAPVEEPKPKEKVISAKNKYTHNRKVQGDPKRGMPNYDGLIPPGGEAGSGKYVRPITLSKWIGQPELDTTKIIDGNFAKAGFEANLIAEGFQTAYLTKYSWINEQPYQMVDVGKPDKEKIVMEGADDAPPKKGDIVLIGHNQADLDKVDISRDKLPGVFVELEDVIELGDNWWSEGDIPNYSKLDEMAKQLGWTTDKLVKTIYGADVNPATMTSKQTDKLLEWNGATFWKLRVIQPNEINDTWVKGQSATSKEPFGMNAWGKQGASFRHGPGGMAPLDYVDPAEEITKAGEARDDYIEWWNKQPIEGDYKWESQTPHVVAESWGFNFNKINELADLLPKLMTQIGPAAMLAGGKALRLLDYGEMVYGTLATGINPILKKLGTPGKKMAEIVGQSSKIGKGPALAGPQVKGAPGKVLRAGQRASTGSVAAMANYEKYNFLYGLASGLILSAMETIGVVASDTFGKNSIREALGPEYFDWAADNGIIDMVGPYPLMDSLREAEAEGILSDGFVEEYQDWTNNKWINVLYEFLGTEGYEDMESVNVVWRDKRLPKNWLGSINDVFGLQNNSVAMNASFIPETGLMPAIKRSPIISGIEIPFENWFLPKVGLDEWVTPMEEYIYGSTVYDEMNELGDIPNVDNTAWLGNAMNAGG